MYQFICMSLYFCLYIYLQYHENLKTGSELDPVNFSQCVAGDVFILVLVFLFSFRERLYSLTKSIMLIMITTEYLVRLSKTKSIQCFVN